MRDDVRRLFSQLSLFSIPISCVNIEIHQQIGVEYLVLIQLLLVFSDIENKGELVESISESIKNASRPLCLNIAVHESFKECVNEESLTHLPRVRSFVYYSDEKNFLNLLLSEVKATHFLHLKGPYFFLPKWDLILYFRYKKIVKKRALLTGVIFGPHSHAKAQAFLPGVDVFNSADTFSIIAGLPLVHSERPVRTLIINPALIFGSVDFLSQVNAALDTLSIEAYIAEYEVYAIDRIPFWPVAWLSASQQRPNLSQNNNNTLQRFERMTGLTKHEGKIDCSPLLGLFFQAKDYGQIASKYQFKNVIKEMKKWKQKTYKKNKNSILWVSGYIDFQRENEMETLSMLRFHFLALLENLSMLIFTGGSQERYIRSNHPNTQNYPTYLLNDQKNSNISKKQFFTQHKFELLLTACKRQTEFTHYLWGDLDLLHYPIKSDVQLNFEHLMDEKIHLAIVDDVMDLSFVVVPKDMIKRLNEAIDYEIYNFKVLMRQYSEIEAFKDIYNKNPEWFTLHKMIQPKMLGLTIFPRTWLSQADQSILYYYNYEN